MLPQLDTLLYEKGLPYGSNLYNVSNSSDLPVEILHAVEFIKAKLDSIEDPKILIIGDGDTDGFVSTKIAYNTLSKNYYTGVTFPKGKKHGIMDLLTGLIDDFYDVVIILDSGTNDITGLQTLLLHNKIVLVIDHHEVNTTPYPLSHENFHLLNCKLFEDKRYSQLSAGYLTYLFTSQLNTLLGKVGQDLEDLAIVSLYSDSCSLVNEVNRGLVTKGLTLPQSNYLSQFMRDEDVLNASFSSWRFAPKINNLFRMENIDLIMDLISEDNLKGTIAQSEMAYKTARGIREDFLGNAFVNDRDNLAVVDLSMNKPSLYKEVPIVNFTGVIANTVASNYTKAALVCAKDDAGLGDEYKCSFRDFYGRDVLQILSRLPIEGGGHKSAFGFTCKVGDLPKVIDYIDKYLNVLALSNTHTYPHNIIQTSTLSDMNTFHNLECLNDYAVYNQIASGDLHPVILKSYIGYQPTIKRERNRTIVRDRNIIAVIFDRIYQRDVNLYLKPQLNRKKDLLLVGGVKI